MRKRSIRADGLTGRFMLVLMVMGLLAAACGSEPTDTGRRS